MEKKLRVLFTIIMAAVMFFALAIPASAETEFEFDSNPQWIQELYAGVGGVNTVFKDNVEERGAKVYSNNEDILYAEPDGTLVAKSEGTVIVAVVYEDGGCNYYKFSVTAPPSNNVDTSSNWIEDQKVEYDTAIKEKQEDEIHVMEILGPILILLVVSLVLAEIGYIFVTAPKCGMSRLWALAPVIGNVFGLVVFLVLRSVAKQNTATTKNVIVCPVCNGRHPYGTDVCSICGTKLSK